MNCITIVPNIRQFLGKDLDYIIDSVLDHNIEIPNYNPLSGSICIKLSKELNHPNKVFINIQSFDDNECFKWCLLRYLHPADHNPARIRKIGKLFGDKLDFRRHNISKIGKTILSTLVFLAMKTKKNIFQSMCHKNDLKKNILSHY